MDCVVNGIATLRCIPVFMGNIVSGAVILSGISAVFFIVFSGFKFLTSGGDPVKVEGAKKSITFAVIGLVIILLSFVLVKVLSVVTGVPCSVIGVNC